MQQQLNKLKMGTFVVTTNTDNSEKILGYATGERQDIEEYYSADKVYGIYLRPITVVNVDSKMVKERLELIEKRAKLQTELIEIEKQLNR